MNCEKFLAWLDETESSNISTNLPDDIKSHITSCKKCKKHFHAQQKALSLLVGLSPSAEMTSRIIQSTTRQISQNSFSITNTEPNTISIAERVSNFFKAYSLQIVGGLALIAIMYLATAAIFPKNIIISGNGSIVRMAKQIDLEGNIIRIQPSDKLVLKNQTAMIILKNKDCIEITGTADFTFSNRSIQMKEGNAELQFSPSSLGYKVKLNQTAITVVGTILQIETNTIKDSILVEEGKITWESFDGQNSGILVEKQGIKALNGKYIKISKQGSASPIVKEQSKIKHEEKIIIPISEAEPLIPSSN